MAVSSTNASQEAKNDRGQRSAQQGTDLDGKGEEDAVMADEDIIILTVAKGGIL